MDFRQLARHTKVDYLAWSPDGRRLALADENGAKIIAVDGGWLVRRLGPSMRRGEPVAWSPDGNHLAWCGGIPWGLNILRVATGETVRTLDIPHACFTLSWSPDGSLIAAGGGFCGSVWDPLRGEKVSDLVFYPRREVDSGFEYPDTRMLGNCFGMPFGVGAIAWLPSSRRLVVSGERLPAMVYAASTGRRIRKLMPEVGGTTVSGGPLNKQVALALPGGGIRLVDPSSGAVGATLVRPGVPAKLAWSPDGTRIAVTQPPTAVTIRDAQTGEGQLVLEDQHCQVDQLTWSPDVRHLAAKCAHGFVLVWDRVTGQELTAWTERIPPAPGLGGQAALRNLMTRHQLHGDVPGILELMRLGVAVGHQSGHHGTLLHQLWMCEKRYPDLTWDELIPSLWRLDPPDRPCPTIQAGNRESALHRNINREASSRMIRALIGFGVDPGLVDYNKRNAAQVAIEVNRSDLEFLTGR